MVCGLENENKPRHVLIISLIDSNFSFILHMRRCDMFLLFFSSLCIPVMIVNPIDINAIVVNVLFV